MSARSVQGAGVLLGTPETRRRGRSTRKARRALTSNPPGLPPDWPPESASLVIISRTTLNNLAEEDGEEDEGMPRGRRVKAEREARRTEQSALCGCGSTVPLCTLTCTLCMGFFYVCLCECVCVFTFYLFRTSSQFAATSYKGPSINTCACVCVCVSDHGCQRVQWLR